MNLLKLTCVIDSTLLDFKDMAMEILRPAQIEPDEEHVEQRLQAHDISKFLSVSLFSRENHARLLSSDEATHGQFQQEMLAERQAEISTLLQVIKDLIESGEIEQKTLDTITKNVRARLDALTHGLGIKGIFTAIRNSGEFPQIRAELEAALQQPSSEAQRAAVKQLLLSRFNK
jgi:hypothetical protein